MLLGLIAAALQVAPPAVAVPTPPAPPTPLIRTSPFPPRPVATFRVRVLGGDEVLVDERLRVGNTSATINRSQTQALEGNCPAHLGSISQLLSLSIRDDVIARIEPDRYRVELRWQRPVQQGCDGGTRTVSIDQSFALRPGQSASFTGDGGLRLELRRE